MHLIIALRISTTIFSIELANNSKLANVANDFIASEIANIMNAISTRIAGLMAKTHELYQKRDCQLVEYILVISVKLLS